MVGPANRMYSAIRHLLRLLVLMSGLIAAVAGQAALSRYAAMGKGVVNAEVAAGPIIFSLLAALVVAVTLNWSYLQYMSTLWHSRRTTKKSFTPIPHFRWNIALRHILIDTASRLSALWQTWRGRILICSLLLALFTSLMADLGALTSTGRPIAQWWWIASVILLLVAASMVRPTVRPKLWSTSHVPAWALLPDGAALTALTLGALLLRLPNLTGIPLVVHGDEASCGLEALRWLRGQVPSLLDTGWLGLPEGGYGLPALVMRFAAADLYGLRLSSVLIGTLSILCTYALAREFCGRRCSLVAAGLLTVAHLHVQFSRMGVHNIHAVLVVVFTLWLLVRALRTGGVLPAVLAGVGLSFSLQVYWGARILFLVIPIFLVAMLALSRHLLVKRGITLTWFALSSVIALGPLVVYLLFTPALTSRTQDVFIFSAAQSVQAHLVSQFGTSAPVLVLLRQLAAVPLIFGGLADQSLDYGPQTAMLDPLIAALATIGLIHALLHLRQPKYLLLVVWVGVTILFGGVLTIDQPWWPRLIVMLPALCILTALVAEELVEAFAGEYIRLTSLALPQARGQYVQSVVLSSVLLFAMVAASAVQTWQHYFVDYAHLVATDAYRTCYTDIADYVARLPKGVTVVLYTHDDVIFNYETIRFLAPNVQGRTVHTDIELRDALRSHPNHVSVIVMPTAQDDFQRALTGTRELPPGIYTAHAAGYAFDTYSIS